MNSEYWTEYYKHNIPFTEPSNFARFVLDYIKTNLNDYKKLNIQDIGCGDARDTVFFKQNNLNIEGLDRCETIIEKNRILYPDIIFNTKNDTPIDIYYLRFVLHTLSIDEIHELISSLSLRIRKHYICIETRSTSDANFLETSFNSGIGEVHKRTLLSKGYLNDILEKNRYTILYSEEVSNLNKYKDDNPNVIRIIARHKKDPIKLSDEEIIAMIRRTRDIIKPKQVKILRLFDIWAKANNLQYFLDYGSLLGAIRDGGMIPYDDDIDVSIDETRLQELIKDTNKIIVENEEFIITPSFCGIFYYFRNKECGKIDLFTFKFRNQLINRPDIIYKTKRVISYRYIKNVPIIYSSEFNLKNIQFEGLIVPIPVKSDELLKLRYGNDYMTIYYAINHQYSGYTDTDYYNNNLRKLTRKEVYDLVRRAK
jgi:hypothetical protein